MYSSTKAMKKKTRVVKIFECQKMLQRNRVIWSNVYFLEWK